MLKDSQLSTLGCAATSNLDAPYTRQSPLNTFSLSVRGSLRSNALNDSAKQLIKAAAGDRVQLEL